jgi:hypothetical protein
MLVNSSSPALEALILCFIDLNFSEHKYENLFKEKGQMKKLIQKFLINLLIVFLILTITEYLLKFGFNVFSVQKLMEILPGKMIDFVFIALFFVILYLIRFRKKK